MPMLTEADPRVCGRRAAAPSPRCGASVAPLEATPETAGPAVAARLPSAAELEDGEIVVLAVRPSLWFLPLSSLWTLASIVLLIALVFFGAGYVTLDQYRLLLIQSLAILAVVRLVYAFYLWASRWYVLTNRRVMWLAGGLRPLEYATRLRQIRESRLEVSPGQRLLGLGTLHMPPRNGENPEIVWHHLRRPQEVQHQVQKAIDAARNNHHSL
jgi:hypothetical protein